MTPSPCLHYFNSRLHAQALLGEHGFAAGEVGPRRESRNATCGVKLCSPCQRPMLKPIGPAA
jgi:hypothetical protein